MEINYDWKSIPSSSATTPLVSIEVKSGGRKQTLPGIAAFNKTYHPTAKLLVDEQGMPIADFLQDPASHWLGTSL